MVTYNIASKVLITTSARYLSVITLILDRLYWVCYHNSRPPMTDETNFHVLITGVGFLGRNLSLALRDRHPRWKIDALDIRPPDDQLRQSINTFIHADVRSEESVKTAFNGYIPNLVVHTAGVVPGRQCRYSTRPEDWERVRAVNYHGTVNVLNAAMASGCKHFIYTSSVTVVIDDLDQDYPNMNEKAAPTNLATLHYGRSKALAEAFVLSPSHAEKGLKACALRPCTIIGPDDTQVISLIHDLITKGETCFILGDGHNLSDWMYIDNAVDAHILAIENLLLGPQTAAGHAFFVTNQEPVYFWDFLACVWAQFGHTPRFRVHIPVQLAFVVAFILEFLTWLTGTPATLHRGSVKDGTRSYYANNEKAIRVLGYRPIVGMSEGVRRSCEGYKRQLAETEKLGE
jgi:sterol-4alpha-carboxylate 3-dehydrogenase (decarboxylating)